MGSNVILSTPTGSGKSLVATGAHFAALANGQRSFYTAPIKALVSEKFFALCEVFGPASVGMMTGDASVNAKAPIICCHRRGARRDRAPGRQARRRRSGRHGRVPLLRRTRPRLGLAGPARRAAPGAVPADVGHSRRHVTRFEEDLTRRTGWPTAIIVKNAERPVPLIFSFSLEPLHETLSELLTTNQAPIYVVHSTQAAAVERAQALMSTVKVHPGREGRDRGDDRALPLRLRLRQDAVPVGSARDRCAPRGNAASLSASGGGPRPVRPAQGHLRHRHAGRGHQRADPHRRVHRAGQVRRQEDPAAPGAGVPPDRGPRRAGGLRHRGPGRGAGTRARHRERAILRQDPRQGRRRRRARAPPGGQRRSRPKERSPGASPPSSGWSPPSPSRSPRRSR